MHNPAPQRTLPADPSRSLLARLSLAIVFTLLSPVLQAGNSYPIVFVHGFTGWGPGEMGSLHYWGGHKSIPSMLNKHGHSAYEGVVGPLASNWDRACELYAYIKGGQVDYGAAHAARYGHQRFGRSFPGLLPDWGEPGNHARIHLVGHSQGGQTIRVLTSLLADGDEQERRLAAPGQVHPLFRGGQRTVSSVTSLATPHDGTTLATMLADDAGFLLGWLLALASYVADNYESAPSYDFKLDQWGLTQRPDEDDKAYRERLLTSRIWNQEDISIRDLRPAGAAVLNTRFPAVDSVFYFSWATRDSVPSVTGNSHLPAPGMSLVLMTPSIAIGRYLNSKPEAGLPNFDSSWWPNDGVVNTVSMAGPRIASPDRIVNLSKGQAYSRFEPGIWHFMGELTGWDHLDIVGQQTRLDYRDFYRALAGLLAALPAGDAE